MASNKILCPYCFEKIGAKDLKFKCNNRNCANPIFEKKGLFGIPNEAVCPNCDAKMKTQKKVCPHCLNELPNAVLECDNFTLAIIGAKETGKSHYIAVLKNVLDNTLSGLFSYSFTPANDYTINRYRDEFGGRIYNEHATISATQSSLIDSSVANPLIYVLKFFERTSKGVKTLSVVTVSFFDTAGEDLDAEDIISVNSKYIYNASGIILLMDPLQLEGIRNQLNDKVTLPGVNSESKDILTRVSSLIRKAKGMSESDVIDIPLAVSYTKMDVWNQLLPPSSYVNQASSYYRKGYFDLNEFETVNGEVEAMVHKWDGDGILQQMRANFSSFAFFGVSALGCNPMDNGDRIDKVIPMRVEDPFLWLLYKNKIIKGSK